MSIEMDGRAALAEAPRLEGIAVVDGTRLPARAQASGESGEFQPALLQGIDTVGNVLLDTVVTASQTASSGGTSSSYYSVATSYEELCSSLQLSAKATAAFGATGTATAKMKFANDFRMTTYGVAAVAYARRCEGTVQATAYSLSDDAYALIESDPGAFARAHGDSWVKSVETGGEYYAVYMFYCQSTEQQQQISAKLKAGVNGSSAEFKMAIDSAVSTHAAESQFAQEVSGDPADPVPTSPDDMAAYAHTFLSTTLNNPVVFDYTVLGYEKTASSAGKLPTSFGQVAENRKNLVGSDSSYAQQLADLDVIVSQCDSLVGTASDNPGKEPGIYRFYGYADAAVTAALAQAEADRDAIEALFEQYEDDPAAAIGAPVGLPSLALGAPELRVGYGSLSLAGTSGHGTYFSDLDQDGLGDYYCSNHRRVARIATHNNDDGIGLLETTYDDPTGIAGTGGKLTYQRGYSSDSADTYHLFGEDETVTQIDLYSKERRMHDGKHWMCVTAMVIHYTDAAGKAKTWQTSGGFYDGCGVTTYRFGDQPDGTRTVFIGWEGYAADSHVYGLRPVQATLYPASWPDQE